MQVGQKPTRVQHDTQKGLSHSPGPLIMPCKCGATDHMRTTSRKCPLNKKLESSEDEPDSSESGGSDSSEEGSESEEESSEEESDSSEGESEGEVRYDVHGPAPEGFAQLDIASSEWEAPEAPADTRKRSSRKRRLVDRFEAGAASSKAPKRKAAKRSAIPKFEASKARKGRKAAKRSAIPKRSASSFHLPNLPSFADKYPALFAQTQNVTPSLQDDIYDATQEHVLCRMDIDNHVDHCLTVARNFINVVRDIRSDNGLEDVPYDVMVTATMDHVAVKSRAAYMSSHGCPDPAPIAEKMPAPDVDPSMSCKQVFQAAYDTTKTEAFFEAVRSVVPEAEALIYAVKRWHEDHVSAPVHEFLLGYARILYSRHVVDMNVDL